jgi:hypothetical protein
MPLRWWGEAKGPEKLTIVIALAGLLFLVGKEVVIPALTPGSAGHHGESTHEREERERREAEERRHTEEEERREKEAGGHLHPTRYVESLQVTTTKSATGNGANVSGRNYPHGVTIETIGSSKTEPNGVAYALPGNFSAFRAVVGVDPTSAPGFSGTMEVEVASGGQAIGKTEVSRGSLPCVLNVSLKGASNLELEAYTVSGEPLALALGEARVVGEKDLPKMPSGQPCV